MLLTIDFGLPAQRAYTRGQGVTARRIATPSGHSVCWNAPRATALSLWMAPARIGRRVTSAAFRDQRTLENFNWSFNSSINKRQIYDLATGRFIRERRDVLLYGPPGSGKSHVVQGIGYSVIKAGFVVYYRSIFDVVRDFLHDEAFDGHEKVLNHYLKPDLLIIDDMGMKQLPKRSGEYLFEIIMRRNETRSTMMTSNRPLED